MKNSFEYKKVHFIGILGISMSALARWTYELGVEVSGSDKVDNVNLRQSLSFAEITIGSNFTPLFDVDLVVHTASVPQNDLELCFAKNKGIAIMDRAHYLSYLCSMCDKLIAVSGTHGKTTTTTMITEMLLNCGAEFTAHIGGISKLLGSNYYHSGDKLCVTEACEYKDSFLTLKPHIGIVLNIDYDHPDYYKSLDDLKHSFYQFMDNVDERGYVIVPDTLMELPKIKARYITVGEKKGSDIRLVTKVKKDNKYFLGVSCFGGAIDNYLLMSPLEHNATNALFVIAVSELLHLPVMAIKYALATFCGSKRRFERRNDYKGASVYLDYAHHPKELASTLKGILSDNKGKKIICFEPHTYSRTMSLYDNFCSCFEGVDCLILLPTYASREKSCDFDIEKKLLEDIKGVGKKFLCMNYYDCIKTLDSLVAKGDTLLIMGAGDIDKLATMLKDYSNSDSIIS